MSLVSVGRQPIFDRSLGVLGFELLYRASSEASTAAENGDHATAQVVVSTYTELGQQRLTGENLAFLNITRNFVTGAMPLPVPAATTVLELLPTVGADDEVIAGMQRLRAEGFRLALDDYGPGDAREALLPYCDLVKVDIARTPPAQLLALVESLRELPVRLAATRVEGLDDMSRGMELGFDFFQGYHLVRPDVVTAKVVTPSQSACTDLLALLHSRGTKEEVEQILRTDVALSYRLLRALGGTFAAGEKPVDSLNAAIEVLGPKRVRAWLQLLMVTEIDRPTEGQLSAALTRARACELVSEANSATSPGAAFLVGLVSSLDNVLGASTSEIVARLPLTEQLADAVLTRSGPLGATLTAVVAQENDEESSLDLGNQHLNSFDLSRIYLDAVGWSLQVCENEGSSSTAGEVDISLGS